MNKEKKAMIATKHSIWRDKDKIGDCDHFLINKGGMCPIKPYN